MFVSLFLLLQVAMEQRNSLIEQLREHLSQSDMASANTYDSGVRLLVGGFLFRVFMYISMSSLTRKKSVLRKRTTNFRYNNAMLISCNLTHYSSLFCCSWSLVAEKVIARMRKKKRAMTAAPT